MIRKVISEHERNIYEDNMIVEKGKKKHIFMEIYKGDEQLHKFSKKFKRVLINNYFKNWRQEITYKTCNHNQNIHVSSKGNVLSHNRLDFVLFRTLIWLFAIFRLSHFKM